MSDLQNAITGAVHTLFGVGDAVPELSFPDQQFGDFSTNVALRLSKQLGKNPREIAQAIADEVQAQKYEWLASTTVAGPGFLNFTLSDSALWDFATQEPLRQLQGTSVVLEYSCPNAFKELHAGHLYQTLVGDALGNLFVRAGATVHRTNFGGDVGLHVAKSMWGIQSILGGCDPAKLAEVTGPKSEFLSKAYVLGAKTYEQDESAKSQIEAFNKQIYALHDTGDHDSDFAQIYWQCREWSYQYFTEFYAQIEVQPFDRFYPESETTKPGLALVRESHGVFESSDGAVVFKGEDIGLHTRVFITRENLPTYETKDLGVIKLEHDEYAFEKRILITGNDQTEYMKVVFAAAERVLPDVAHKMQHITNGTIRFGDGQKMSSRLGNVSRAIDVIDGARELIHAETEDLQKTISLAAVKYSFLKQRVGGDIAFDLEESVSIHGNSGPYLQYAAVRANSILNKQSNKMQPIAAFDAAERLFVQKLSQYEVVLAQAAQELSQQLVATYLYELSQAFNRFYEDNRVVDDPREAVRTMLVARYAHILTEGLQLLGIRVPEKM